MITNSWRNDWQNMKRFVKTSSTQNSPVQESEYLTEKTKRIRQTVKGTFGKMWNGLLKVHNTTSKFSTNYPKKPVLYCRKMWIWKEIALKKNAHFTRMLEEIWKKGLEIHKQTTSKKTSSNHGDSQIHLCSAVCCCLPAWLSYLLGLKVRSITKHRPDLLYASLLHTSALFSAHCAHCSRTNLKGVSKVIPV